MVEVFEKGGMLAMGQTLDDAQRQRYTSNNQDISVRINALEEQIKDRDARIASLLQVIKVLCREIK